MKVLDFPISSEAKITADLVGPLEEATTAALAGKLKTYALVTVTEAGPTIVHMWHPDSLQEDSMLLLAALDMCKHRLSYSMWEEGDDV